MHAAKETGGATYMFFDSRMLEDARERIELLRDLRTAIEQHQFELFFQPKVDARSEQVTAAEALLRWPHPTRGMVGPDVFIPLAERYGLIVPLGNWVIEEACRQARIWRDAGLRMRVAINLSAYQMRQEDLVDRITNTLKQYGIKPERLTCEITESVAMEDTQITKATFERLGRAGIHLSIDDFGTGYSSLAYLGKLPASELKIDRSFVMDLDKRAGQEIVEAVIRLSHALKLKVVAEGVETQEQRQFLLDKGCDELQGYLFARPMSARALLMWATDDRQTKSNFRPSLFAPTGASDDPNSVLYQRATPVPPPAVSLPTMTMPPAPTDRKSVV
jgi:EAL domain-containing protein (putative c-di-GMP-specific phosphodiesterase class I)